MVDDRLTNSITERLLQLQVVTKKLELWTRPDLTIPQVQQRCLELDRLAQEIE